jgi:hypothetical protein
MSDKQRLEQLLYQLADDIADHGDDPLRWSRQVREAAGLIRRGNSSGLSLFLALFDPVGRPFDQPHPIPNPFTEQAFARTRTCDEAYRLARKLLDEHVREERRLSAAEREIALRPWREGSTGKAVVYKNGSVVAVEDDARGEPSFVEIKGSSGPDAVATIGIKPDGSCDAFRYDCDERWLATRLQEHHPALHLGQMPTRG